MTQPAPPETPTTLTPAAATAFARLALKGVVREYPNHPGHVLGGPQDALTPKALHPAFYGSYDWHSAVHGHWLLVKVLRTHPTLPEAGQIRTVLDAHLTDANVRAEAAYFERKESKSFERPYGWTWLLKLKAELHDWDDADAKRWSANLRPLADLIAAKYVTYYPKQTYPTRVGTHANTAFGLAFAHDYAVAVGDAKLRGLIESRARDYFGKDADYPAAWEPGGADFLSPALAEADLMRRVLPRDEFRTWFARFLPGAAKGEPAALFTPATVTDRSDPQLVHLDGLNLSRAWGMRAVANALPAGDPARAALRAGAARHAAAALPHVASGDFAGEHWLASFAVQLLATPVPE
ncbi:DUF2891 domain-containing protein [bacterium]|nr:DUF2891 domain-containing protein [bacterium]